MTETELAALMQLLMTNTAIGRLTWSEVEQALRLAEARGYQIKAPAA